MFLVPNCLSRHVAVFLGASSGELLLGTAWSLALVQSRSPAHASTMERVIYDSHHHVPIHSTPLCNVIDDVADVFGADQLLLIIHWGAGCGPVDSDSPVTHFYELKTGCLIRRRGGTSALS